MRLLIRAALCVVTAGLLVAGLAGSASAQTLTKLNQVGAALAFPLLAGGPSAATYLTITNVGPQDRNLHFNVISPRGWEVTDFDCPVTASETVLLTWRRAGEGEVPIYELSMECNFGGLAPGNRVSRVFDFPAGTLFVTNETNACGDGTCTTNANDLFGDWVFVSPEVGEAFSAEAIPFQGQDPMAEGVADRDYKFDNEEYSMFPATLASNFFAPGNSAVGQVSASLILFTLDGRANVGSQAALDIVFFDDEETPTSAHYEFDCFTVISLEGINPNFAAPLLGSETGHFYMTVIDADQDSNVHDNKFGNGNNIRVVGVHGWLVQQINGGGLARTLAQGMLPQDLDGNDVPTFDGL